MTHQTVSDENFRYRSQLFTLRVWLEELGDGKCEWRGKIQYVPSGEVRYLREWSMLLAFLLEMLSDAQISESQFAKSDLTLI